MNEHNGTGVVITSLAWRGDCCRWKAENVKSW